jgi:hypothetical protein
MEGSYEKEMTSLQENQTWTLVPLPMDRKKSQKVFKKKERQSERWTNSKQD